MSSSQEIDEQFLRDRLRAYSRSQSQTTSFSERITEPSTVVTILFLLATVVYTYYGPSNFNDVLATITARLWYFLVYITPSSLLDPLDLWLNPQLERPMADPQANHHARKSETMRRVLGLDRSGGMMASVFEVRTRALSLTGNALGFKADSERPPGLGNRDNSCFQNSILQGLASLDSFQKYLEACLSHGSEENEASRAVTQTLRALLMDLNDGSNNGRTLWTPHGLKFMSTWQQQDAQEYYSKILDDIDKSALSASKALQRYAGFESELNADDSAASEHSDDSGYQSLSSVSKLSATNVLKNPLEGLAAQRVACVQCGYSEGLSMIPFNCLTLSLGLGRGQHDLYERLDAYSHVESIEGVECPKCTLLKAQRLMTKLIDMLRAKNQSEEELATPLSRLAAVEEALEEDYFDEQTLTDKCKISAQSKVTTTKTKQVVIARPPQSLAIHMQRSVFDPSTFDMIKNVAPVEFPQTLDLGPWCLGSAESKSAAETTSSEEEKWLLDPNASMIAGDMQPSKLVGPIYELSAVVTHAGRHENGHYICYRKFPKQQPPDSSVTTEGDSAEKGDAEDARAHYNATGDPEKPHRRQKVEMEWWRLSDHNVSRVDEEIISSLSPGVFMLFYDCVDPSMVLQADDEAADMPAAEVNGAHVDEQEESQGLHTRQVDDDRADTLASDTATEDTASSITSVTEVGSSSSLDSSTVVGSDEYTP